VQSYLYGEHRVQGGSIPLLAACASIIRVATSPTLILPRMAQPWRIALAVCSGSLALTCAACRVAAAEVNFARSGRTECTYLIVGAGPAGMSALQALLERASPSETVVVVAPEAHDELVKLVHPPLPDDNAGSIESDAPLTALGRMTLGLPSDIFRGTRATSMPLCVNLMLGRRVTDIDPVSRVAQLDSGESVAFQKCLIAAGGDVHRATEHMGKIVAPDAKGLALFAQTDDCTRKIDEVLARPRRVDDPSSGPHITVVGGSFAAASLGASLVGRGTAVTFCHQEPYFMARHVPKYLSDELMRRLRAAAAASSGHVDTLSYCALRYISREEAPYHRRTDPMFPLDEALVTGALVFDSYTIFDFRTDLVCFAPTFLPAPQLLPHLQTDSGGRFIASPELSVYSDIYASGACVGGLGLTGSDDCVGSDISFWSAERASATGRHAASNMMGGREPFKATLAHVHVDLQSIALNLHVYGKLDGSACETFGYFLESRNRDENTSGGQLESGIIFLTESARNTLRVVGIVVWDGDTEHRVDELTALSVAKEFIESNEFGDRQSMDRKMQQSARGLLGCAPELDINDDDPRDDGGDKKARDNSEDVEGQPDDDDHNERRARRRGRFITRHRPARSVPIKGEIMWAADEKSVSDSTTASKRAEAFDDHIRKARGAERLY
jgi:Pyridine nucleotide-disulphide oxidoreductase